MPTTANITIEKMFLKKTPFGWIVKPPVKITIGNKNRLKTTCGLVEGKGGRDGVMVPRRKDRVKGGGMGWWCLVEKSDLGDGVRQAFVVQ